MTFKDDLKADITTFLDLDEFGELADVDNVILPAQIINSYFRAETYLLKRKHLPKKNEWIWINGVRYDVESSQVEFGICKLVCAAYRQPRGGLR